jgi:hypothetical protein
MRLFFTLSFKKGPIKSVSIKFSSHLFLKTEGHMSGKSGTQMNAFLSVQDPKKRNRHHSHPNVSLAERVWIRHNFYILFFFANNFGSNTII